MESFTRIAFYFNDIRGAPVREFVDELKAGVVKLLPYSYAIYKRHLKREKPSEVARKNTGFCNGKKGVHEVAKVILDNQRRMESLSRGRNAKHLLIIQPWYPLHVSATSEHKQQFYDEIKFRNEVISLVMHDDFCKKSCLDFSKIFDESGDNKSAHSGALLYDGSADSLESALFVDNVHLTDRGVKLVVERLRRARFE